MSNPTMEYSRAFVASVTSIAGALPPLPAEVAGTVFEGLSRQEEQATSFRDSRGNWEPQFPDARSVPRLHVPQVDLAVKTWLCRERPGAWESSCRSRWPGGKRFALCLTHDVDFVSRYCVSLRDCREAIRRALRTSKRGVELAVPTGRMLAKYVLQPFLAPSLGRDEFWHYEDWLRLEDRYGFKSTWFFLAGRLSSSRKWDTCYDHRSQIRFDGRRTTVREMMREIRRRGWDVGLHGSYDSATNAKVMLEEKRQVEESCRAEVLGVRQHYLHYDVGVTPRVQEQAGLRVDSTQGFNRTVGFRAGTCFPYFCWDHEEQRPLQVLEVPQHAMDGALFMESALSYDGQTAIRHMLELMDTIAEMGGCLTLNWHANWLNNPLYWDTYATLLREAKSRNAWGCSVGQLHEWWLKRRVTPPETPKQRSRYACTGLESRRNGSI